jgi:hypothetical protein
MMGGIVGLVPTALIALPFCVDFDEEVRPSCAVSFLTGASVSVSLGVATSVYFTNRFLGGRGEFLPTLIGALAGSAVGGSMGVSTSNLTILFVGLAVGPIIGAALGYELSHALSVEPNGPGPQAHAALQVMPVLGATPKGGLLGGLAGRF